VAGLEEISDGVVRIGDRAVNDLTPKSRDIAMVFQSYALYPHMSVYRNMAFSLKLRGLPKAEIDRRVREVAGILGLSEHLQRKPRQLSGGQRQRVAVGAALCRQAGVLLFDEPLSNLDAKLRVHMRTELKRLHQSIKSTMVYVTHDQVEAMTMGDRIVIMNGGVICQVGTPLEIYDRPATRFVAGFIGSPPMNFFEGEIAADSSGTFLTLPGGVRLPLQRPELAAAPGRRVVFGIRPEHISLAASGRPLSDIAWAALGCPAKVQAVIEVVEPLGHRVIVSAKSAAGLFQMETEIHAGIRSAEQVDLWFDMNRAYLFDRETEATI
ncbi:MAG TPA: ATP-binding cassette domain-containing protein, partial [Thermoanaerobaculia bacterium]